LPWCAETSGLLRIGAFGRDCLMQGTVQLELPGRVASASTAATWRGERFDLSLAYGFSWLTPDAEDTLNVPYAPVDLRLSANSGAQPLLPGMSGDAHGVGMNSQWRLTAASANIDVTGMRGSATIEAESVSGEVTVKASSTEKLELSSVSGDVGFEGEAASVDVETVSGDLRVNGVSGEVSVESVSGSAIVRAATVTEFEAASVSGDIDFEGSVAAGGRIDVESMSGDINLTLPAATGGRVSAEAFSGTLRNDFGLVVEDEEGPGSSMRGKIGDGSATIEIESFSGDVELRKR
jgi:DUF4097 and DUF4098 domain-containing protein YvlB